MSGICTIWNYSKSPLNVAKGEAYGAMLLHSGTESYVTVGVVAFVAGVTITVICMKLKMKKHRQSQKDMT